MVTQFVGFLAAFREATGLPPLIAATLGAILTTWVTFMPCYLWIFAGAPFIERSEEHTSELQSLMRISYAVFCLKKKNTYCTKHTHKPEYPRNKQNQTHD